MKAQEQIEKLAKKLWPNKRVDIYKGWCVGAQREGWIARPFGKNEIYLGSNAKEACEDLRQRIYA